MTVFFRIGCVMTLMTRLLVRGSRIPKGRQRRINKQSIVGTTTTTTTTTTTNESPFSVATLVPTELSYESSTAAPAPESFTQRTWQWPLQPFRIMFMERPVDHDFAIAELTGDYLTQQLQPTYYDTVLLHVQLQLQTTHADWTKQLFVYEMTGYAVLTLEPPNGASDILELQRQQFAALSDTVAMQAFWDNPPLLLPSSTALEQQDNRIMKDQWMWLVIVAAVVILLLGGVLCTLFVWSMGRRQQHPSSAVKESVQATPPLEDAASVAWSTPMGKIIIPATWIVPKTPLDYDEYSMDDMSATPIHATVHQFETDSIIMDGYDSNPDDDDDNDNDNDNPAVRTKQQQQQAQQQTTLFMPRQQPLDDQRQVQPPPVATAQQQEFHKTNIDKEVYMISYGLEDDYASTMDTKKTLFLEEEDEDEEDHPKVSPRDVLGYI